MHRILAAAAVTTMALAAMPGPTAAQEIGIKTGLSFGNVSNSGVLPGDVSGRTGFAAGVSVFTPDDFVSIGGEAFFAQRGVTSSQHGQSRELEYFDVPALLRVRIPTPGLAPYAFAGPQLSYELRCNTGAGKCPGTNRSRTTWAGVIGGGVRFGGDTAISLEGRYLYGLDDLEFETVTDPDSFKTRSFMIVAGITF